MWKIEQTESTIRTDRSEVVESSRTEGNPAAFDFSRCEGPFSPEMMALIGIAVSLRSLRKYYIILGQG